MSKINKVGRSSGAHEKGDSFAEILPNEPRSQHISPLEFTPEAIAKRAYFIGKKRIEEGRPPDPESDWLEAENEILRTLKENA